MRSTIARWRFAVSIGVMAGAAALCSLVVRAERAQDVNTWASLGTVSQPRTAAGAVALSDGRTLIAGGVTADGAVTDSVVLFNPAANEFVGVGHMVAPRSGHTATLLKDGRVVIVGGRVGTVISADVEIFDVNSGSSTIVASMAQPRTGHAAAALADGKVLIVGGTTVDDLVLTTVDLFDPETSAVMPAAGNLQIPRTNASATTLLDGRVLVAGGSDGVQDLQSAEMFEPSAGTFTLLGPDRQLSLPRSGHTAVLLANNNGVLIAGGRSNGVDVVEADVFVPPVFPDPFTFGVGTFAPTASMAASRSAAIAGSAANGYAFVMGGGPSDAEAYRFATVGTDKDDYAPGERAIIAGTGWQPGEDVTLIFQEDPAVHDDYVLHVTADPQGTLYWDQWAPEPHDLNVRFYMTAVDSKSHAQITFTDSRPNGISLTPTSVEVAPGASAAYQVKATKGGNTNACTITFGAAFTAPAPAGTSVSFGTNPVTMTTADVTTMLTVTTTNSGPSSGRTQPGTYPFTVTATPGSSCQGGTTPLTTSGTLVVTATVAATTTAVAPVTATYGGTTTLSATLTAGGAAVANETIQFALNGISVGTAITDSTGVATLGGVSVAGIDAGSYASAISAAFAGDSSYGSSSGTGALTVTKADAIVAVNGYAGVYDGKAHGATGSATGVSGEDLTALLSLGSTFTDVPGGSATWNFAGNTNYTSQTGAVTIAIAKADATVAVIGYTGVYDGNPHGATGSATGVQGENLGSLLTLGATFTNVPGGVATWAFAGNDNYKSASGTVDIIITKADARIDVAGYTGVYDGDPHGASGTAKGVKGEDLSALLSLGATFTDVPGGTASWTFAGNDNYNAAAGTAAIAITKADAQINVAGYNGVYDGHPHGATGTAKGVKGEDLSGLLSLGNSFTNVPGGTATWTFAGNINYRPASGDVAIVITQAPQVIVWATPASIIYGTPLGPAQLNATLTVGDGVLSYSPGAGAILPVGTQTLTVTAAETLNYKQTTATVSIVVTPWYVTGFYNPVTMGGPSIVNTVKGGSTVALKFNVYMSYGGTELTDVSNIEGFYVAPMLCGAATAEDPVDFTTTGGTILRYDTIGRQFVQNWQTPKVAGTCYMVSMKTKDGQAISAFFKTK